MNKLIESQDGQQIHFMPASTPCYFNIAPALADGEKEGQKNTHFSVGINNVSFGIFKKKENAENALHKIKDFLLNKETSLQIPAEK